MLKHGWTTVRVMGDADVFYGVLDVRRAIEKVFDGPRMTGAAHYLSITGGGGDVNYLSPEQRVIADGLIVNGPMELEKRFVRKSSMARTGSDPGHWGLSFVGDDPKNVAFSPDELLEAVAEAGRHGVPVAARTRNERH